MEQDGRSEWKNYPSAFPERSVTSDRSIVKLLKFARKLYPTYPEVALHLFKYAAKHVTNERSLNYSYRMIYLLQYEKMHQALAGGRNEEATHLKEEMHQTFLKAVEAERGKMASDILCVPQGCIGVSSAARIGTYNIRSCIASFVRNSSTKKTIVAHAHPSASLKAYKELLGREVDPDASWEAFLFGDRHQDKDSFELAKAFKEVFDAKAIHVRTVDIFNPTQPSSITIDPATGNFTEEAPSDINLDSILRASYGNNELRLAFGSEPEYEGSFFCKDPEILKEAERTRSILLKNPLEGNPPSIEQLLGLMLMQEQRAALEDNFNLPKEVTDQILKQRGLYAGVPEFSPGNQDSGPTNTIFEVAAALAAHVDNQPQQAL